MAQPPFDLQGHRGCRALMPENTIPAFFKALELGVNTIEMDVVISRDSQVVVSHEPWMSHVLCTHPDGRPVKKSEEKNLNLYRMNYADIQAYDCGMRFNPDFPDQKKMKAVKPTLKIVVRSVEKFAKDNHYPVPRYNIEIKSEKRGYNLYHPEPKRFVSLVLSEVRRLGIEERTILQSFDIHVLEELAAQPSRKYAISYLVSTGRNLSSHLKKLSFTPEIISPRYPLVTAQLVQQCHDRGMKIIPWTVNDKATVQELKSWGCDGVITDVLIW